jgi:hypothetical protein
LVETAGQSTYNATSSTYAAPAISSPGFPNLSLLTATTRGCEISLCKVHNSIALLVYCMKPEWLAVELFHVRIPPRLQVNRGTCRFGRYKNPRRPHPPPRVSRVSHHPPQVSGLTLAHPPSPTAARSTNRLRLRGSISGPWSARPQWAPTVVSFLGCNA